MVDPIMWAGLPFRNATAWADFVGTFGIWHQVLAEATFALTGNHYRTYPLSDGGGPAWLSAHQQEDIGAANALGITPPPDMESFDLSKAEDFASWTFIVASYHRTLRHAAGIL